MATIGSPIQLHGTHHTRSSCRPDVRHRCLLTGQIPGSTEDKVYTGSTFRVQMIGYGWNEEKLAMYTGRACTTATIINGRSLIHSAAQLTWLFLLIPVMCGPSTPVAGDGRDLLGARPEVVLPSGRSLLSTATLHTEPPNGISCACGLTVLDVGSHHYSAGGPMALCEEVATILQRQCRPRMD